MNSEEVAQYNDLLGRGIALLEQAAEMLTQTNEYNRQYNTITWSVNDLLNVSIEEE